MVNNFQIHPLNMALQAHRIKLIFPDSNISFNHNSLTWKHTIVPSPLSCSYDIKLSFKRGKHPQVFVTKPLPLPLPVGQSKLKHVYSLKKQWLCLYHGKSGQWNGSMYLVDTVIPWACEWLLHYECWVATGSWHGGGIEHESQASNEKEELKDEYKTNKN
jgi:hypothetical protein